MLSQETVNIILVVFVTCNFVLLVYGFIMLVIARLRGER